MGHRMTPEEYKQLSIKEFTGAARVYETDHAGIYEMCKDDYPSLLATTRCSTPRIAWGT